MRAMGKLTNSHTIPSLFFVQLRVSLPLVRTMSTRAVLAFSLLISESPDLYIYLCPGAVGHGHFYNL